VIAPEGSLRLQEVGEVLGADATLIKSILTMFSRHPVTHVIPGRSQRVRA